MKLVRLAPAAVLALLVAVLLAGCGEKEETLGDTTAAFAPGVTATKPPWKPEYAHLQQRITKLGLPPIGKEQFHSHALVHIYNDGLLVPIAPNIGIDPRGKRSSSIHTHDQTGIVHMESEKPHKFKLGDFFVIWGVAFGDNSIGALRDEGDKQVRVYVNGKRVQNAKAYVLRDGDNVSIGYGTDGSFPHNPPKTALKTVSGKGGKQANCSKDQSAKGGGKSCVRGG